MCFALVVTEWNSVPTNQEPVDTKNFTVRIRYAEPDWRIWIQQNFTNSQYTSVYDYENGYFNYMNASLVEVMAGITEQVIDYLN